MFMLILATKKQAVQEIGAKDRTRESVHTGEHSCNFADQVSAVKDFQHARPNFVKLIIRQSGKVPASFCIPMIKSRT